MAVVQPLFPVNLWIENYKEELTDDVILFIENQKWNNNSPSFGNSKSIDHRILENDKLSNIKRLIEQNVTSYAKDVMGYTDVDFYITQSWANKNEPEQVHQRHNHPNSIISGVFYIKCPEHCPAITFVNDTIFTRTIHINTATTKYNGQHADVYPDVGDLLIFPSSLSHSVGIYTGESARISIAFNTFVRGVLGDDGQLTRLEL
jgi:uncharacterized protein (TIGR02466 family)